jgi:hypothetical protein
MRLRKDSEIMSTRKEITMKKVFSKLHALVVCVLLVTCPLVRASATVATPDQSFSNDELDQLLSPIALYPDPLLAQVIPAATFFDQLEEANQALGGRSDDTVISTQSWDVTVKSVAHYPQVLQKMVQDRDWTIALGQAYVNQSTDVAKSIQRLRAEAKSAGSLVTTSEQQVIVEGEVIKIVPAQPQVIYVPQYNPEVVYVDKGPSTGAVVAAAAISFGAGLAIGAWLNNDWDWHGRGIYYHGWAGGGWVGVNRSFVNVNVNRNVYINNRYNHVNVNRNITTRNINNYRTNLNRTATVRQNNITRNNINRNNINRNDINRNNINRNNINRNNINRNESIATTSTGTISIGTTSTGTTATEIRSTETKRSRTAPRSLRGWIAGGRRKTQLRVVIRTRLPSGGGGNREQIKQDRNRGSSSMNRVGAGGGGQQRSIGGGGGARKPGGGGGLRKRG